MADFRTKTAAAVAHLKLMRVVLNSTIFRPAPILIYEPPVVTWSSMEFARFDPFWFEEEEKVIMGEPRPYPSVTSRHLCDILMHRSTSDDDYLARFRDRAAVNRLVALIPQLTTHPGPCTLAHFVVQAQIRFSLAVRMCLHVGRLCTVNWKRALSVEK